MVAEQPALSFAGLLRQLRAEARLTQEELAEAAGLSPRSVSDLERGINRTAHKDTAVLLAGALGLAGPARALFVAAARGHVPAAQVLAAGRGAAPRPRRAGWPVRPYRGLVRSRSGTRRCFSAARRPPTRCWTGCRGGWRAPGLLVVSGESGAGKSSLLRAG